MCFAGLKASRVVSPQDVDLSRNWLQMIRIDAKPIATKMIELECRVADQERIRDAVSFV